jgi:hypothetical protein
MEKKVLTEYTAGVWFIHGLPPSAAGKLIRKFAIDTEDPDTVAYQKQLDHIMRQTASDKAIQRMNATRTPSQQQTEVVDLVGRLQPAVSVTKEQRLADPIVKPATKAGESSVGIDQLTKAFEKLSVNLIKQVQAQAPQQTQGPVGSMVDVPGGNYPSVNVRAYRMQQRPMGSQRLKDGVCWYCFNQDPRYQDLLYRFRHQCP